MRIFCEKWKMSVPLAKQENGLAPTTQCCNAQFCVVAKIFGPQLQGGCGQPLDKAALRHVRLGQQGHAMLGSIRHGDHQLRDLGPLGNRRFQRASVDHFGLQGILRQGRDQQLWL